LETNASYTFSACELAFKKEIELELSTTIGNGVLIISNSVLLMIGFINNNRRPKIEAKRKKAKSQYTLV
jgi:hypothetical protein